MKVTVYQTIALKDNYAKGLICIHKNFESDVIPHQGDKIGDSIWKDPYEYEVSEVVINYRENTCTVNVEMVLLESDEVEQLKTWKHLAELHDWEVIGHVY
ncbi:MAG: hypothetical protein ABRQ25_08945 [Clostridiaceae bacterium]